ncbi:MAG: DALR anticodon-binding domain-containing protein [Lapillicoccus sp.]
MPADLDAAVRAVVPDVLAPGSGGAPGDPGPQPRGVVPRVGWRPDAVGRWSSPVARRLADTAGRPAGPLACHLAVALAERLGHVGSDAFVEVVGDGFLAVTPGRRDLAGVVTAVLAAGPAYGRPPDPVRALVVDPSVPQRRTPENPLFVVMWAHARCHVLPERHGAAGSSATPMTPPASTATSSPSPPSTAERLLVLRLADLPRAVLSAGGDPATVLRRLHEVALSAHRWLDELGALDGSDPPPRRAAGSPALAVAARVVLATGLDVLGLPAPDHL